MIDLESLIQIVFFVANAVVGGIAYVFFWNVKERNEEIRHIVLAGVSGYIYYMLYSSYSFPNALMSIVVGWFAPDFIAGVMEKMKPKKPV